MVERARGGSKFRLCGQGRPFSEEVTGNVNNEPSKRIRFSWQREQHDFRLRGGKEEGAVLEQFLVLQV